MSEDDKFKINSAPPALSAPPRLICVVDAETRRPVNIRAQEGELVSAWFTEALTDEEILAPLPSEKP